MKHWIIYGGGLVTACLLAYPYVASRFDNSEIIISPGARFRLSNEEIESHSDAALIHGDLSASKRLIDYYSFCCPPNDMSMLWLILSAAMGDVNCSDRVKLNFHVQEELDDAVQRLAKRIQLKRKKNTSHLDVVISILSEGGVEHVRNGTGVSLDFVKDAIDFVRECDRQVLPR